MLRSAGKGRCESAVVMTSNLGIGAGVATAGLWAVTAMFFTAGGKRVGSLAVNVIRLTLGLGALTLFGVITRGELAPMGATGHAWLWLSLSGVAGMAVCDLCLFESFLWVGPRVGMLMLTLAPPVAALIGWLLMGEELTAPSWAGMAMALTGVMLVVRERPMGPDGRRRSHPAAGVVLGALAMLSQAVGFALSKYGMDVTIDGRSVSQCAPFAAAQIRELAGLGAMVIFYFVIRAWPRTLRALRDRRAMGLISLGALTGPFLGVSMSMVALKYAAVGVASTLMAMAPLFVIPLVMIFHKEKVSLRSVLGAAIAVGGVAVLVLSTQGG